MGLGRGEGGQGCTSLQTTALMLQLLPKPRISGDSQKSLIGKEEKVSRNLIAIDLFGGMLELISPTLHPHPHPECCLSYQIKEETSGAEVWVSLSTQVCYSCLSQAASSVI